MKLSIEPFSHGRLGSRKSVRIPTGSLKGGVSLTLRDRINWYEIAWSRQRSSQFYSGLRMDVNTLKQQCRRITEEILEFLDDRNRSAPKGTPTPNPWQATNFEKLRHGAETLALYQERFSAKVMELSAALRQEGYCDAEFEALLRQPPNPASLRNIAEKLRAWGGTQE